MGRGSRLGERGTRMESDGERAAGVGEGKLCHLRAASAKLTQVVIVFLLALFRQGSALGICNGDPQHHPEGTRLHLSPRASRAGVGAPRHPPAPPFPTRRDRAPPASFAAHHHRRLPAGSGGQGRTCQLSLLGEVGGAGAAGDTYKRGRHLGVPAIDIHVTAGHRQLKTRGTGGLAPSGAMGPGFKPSCLASGM